MGILAWIILGALAGWIASMIMKADGQMGALANITVGIVGAFIGGWVLSLTGLGGDVNGLNLGSLITAVLGAILLIALIRFIRGQRAA